MSTLKWKVCLEKIQWKKTKFESELSKIVEGVCTRRFHIKTHVKIHEAIILKIMKTWDGIFAIVNMSTVYIHDLNIENDILKHIG